MTELLNKEQIGSLFNWLKHGDREHQEWLLTAIRAWSAGEPKPHYEPTPKLPLPLILTCPSCGGRHVDKGLFATKPHHTHACQHCGLTWRPAIEPTVGVQFLPGFKDEET